jgi:hypothetical protein
MDTQRLFTDEQADRLADEAHRIVVRVHADLYRLGLLLCNDCGDLTHTDGDSAKIRLAARFVDRYFQFDNHDDPVFRHEIAAELWAWAARWASDGQVTDTGGQLPPLPEGDDLWAA